MLLLLLVVYACILLSESFPKGSDTRALPKTWHFMLGLKVFELIWFRLIAKLVNSTPLIEPPIARWQDLTAKAVRALLYLLMITMPLLGWLRLGAAGKSIPFYGWQLPALVAENKGITETVKDVHEAGATVIYFLVGIHALAALCHHYFVRDKTLRQTLP